MIMTLILTSTCKMNAQTNIDSISIEQTLSEVVVKANNIITTNDKIIIRLTEKVKNNTHDGYSVLATLQIPGLDVDPIEKVVKTRGNNSIICINGREVNEDEVKTLNPHDIKRIDYYQDYDPNHPLASSVIDFILKHHDNGGIFYANANQHLNIVNGNDVFDLRYYHKKTELNIQLSDSYNHFTSNKTEESSTNMSFGNETIMKNSLTHSTPQHSNGLSGKMSYLKYGKDDMLQIAAYISNMHDAKQMNTIDTYSSTKENIPTIDNTHKDYISPALQVYYQKITKRNGIFRTSLYANYNHTTLSRDYMSAETYVSDTKDKFIYFNPNVLLGVTIGKHRPFFNASYHYNNSTNTYTENEKHNKQKLVCGQGIFTLGDNYVIIPKCLRITPQLSERIITIDNGISTKTKYYFSPSLFLDADLTHGNTVRGNVSMGTYDPQMKYYNAAEQRTDPFQILKGNSNLKIINSKSVELTFNSNHKWGMLEVFTAYTNNSKAIYEDVTLNEKNNLFIHTFVNGGTQEKLILNTSLKLNLIQQRLSWMLSGEYDYYKERNFSLQTLSNFIGYTSLMYANNNIQGKIELLSPIKYISRGYEFRCPLSLKISLGYTIKNWHLDLYMRNPFIDKPSKQTYYNEKYYNHMEKYEPKISSNMVQLSIAYRISYGKKHDFQQIDMNNTNRTSILENNNKNDK